MRDEFSAEVKRILASRAGNGCSVCTKPTSGPSSNADAALSDGIAAHITAASVNGPRFDPSLTAEQRSSAENGIWVCTRHGREIDADSSAYTVELLRGLKWKREEVARREAQRHGVDTDHSAALIELPHATTGIKLFEITAPQPYTYQTAASFRQLLQGAEQPHRILELASEVIPEVWDTHANVAGILSTLLSNMVDFWQPTKTQLVTLEKLCSAAVEQGDWSRVASVEPLAFALSAKGQQEIHRRVLERLIESSHWRDADSVRVRAYYGNVGVEIAAIMRHWHDPFRKGLLRVNDVARLIDLLLSADASLTPAAHTTMLDLLDRHALALQECGEDALARKVKGLVTALQDFGAK